MHFRSLSVAVVSLCLLPTTALAMFREDVTLPRAAGETNTGTLLNENVESSPASPDAVLEISVPVITKPETQKPLSRIDFTAALVSKLYSKEEIDRCFWDLTSSLPPHFTLVFTDVAISHPLAKHTCMALRNGFIRGYGDGSFRPDQMITFAEASKVLSRAYALAPYADVMLHDPWYHPYLASLAVRGSIPKEITRLDQPVSTFVLQTMITRIEQDETLAPSRDFHYFEPFFSNRAAVLQKKIIPIPGPPAKPSAQSSSSSSRRKYFWESF